MSCRDLSVSKTKAELLDSRLQLRVLPLPATKTCLSDPSRRYISLLRLTTSLSALTLFAALSCEQDPPEWHLFFTGSSLLSAKSVLLHNGNVHPSKLLATQYVYTWKKPTKTRNYCWNTYSTTLNWNVWKIVSSSFKNRTVEKFRDTMNKEVEGFRLLTTIFPRLFYAVLFF